MRSRQIPVPSPSAPRIMSALQGLAAMEAHRKGLFEGTICLQTLINSIILLKEGMAYRTW